MKRWFAIFMTVSCQTSQVSRPIPSADAGLQAKITSKLDQSHRVSKELFVEKKNVELKKKSENTSGSLFGVQSPNAYLFSKKIPFMPGDYLTLKVEPVSASGKPLDQNSGQKSGEMNGSSTPAKDSDKNSDALTTDLTAAMPNLGPDESSNGKVLPEIQAEVIHRTPEGDLIVRAHRSSTVDGRSKEVSFEAMIPSRVVSESDNFSTKDLRSVKFSENGPESIRRNSTAWNDEYSLRFSGFTETGSKNARQLADDKKKLEDVRGRLDDRIKAFAADRSRFAKERTKFLDDRGTLDRKLSDSERLVKDKEAYIAKLESELSQSKNAQTPNSLEENKVPTNQGNSGTAASQTSMSKASDAATSTKQLQTDEKQGGQNVAKQ